MLIAIEKYNSVFFKVTFKNERKLLNKSRTKQTTFMLNKKAELPQR